MIRRTILAALLLTAAQAPTLPSHSAAQGMDALRQATAGLPSVLAQNPDRIQAVVVDFAVLSAIAGGQGDLSVEALRRLTFGGEVPALSMLRTNGVEAWSDAAGVAPGHIRTLTGIGTSIAIWRFDSAIRQERVVEHLGQSGFQRAGADMLQEPGPIPIQQRMSDPWRSLQSNGVAVAIANAGLVQAPTSDVARRFVAISPSDSFAADPAVQALLSGAEAQLGERRVVQALFFSPVLALRAGDPAAMLDGSPREAMERMRQAQAESPAGVPPFLRGLMLDVTRPGQAGLLIALAYPDCGTAQVAGGRVQGKWNNPSARVTARAVPVAGSPCAASILVEAETTGLANPVLSTLWDAILRREPTPIDIGP
nr:hypothetical protein [uncultured Roseococcus sp.]